jgi:hypothetical protein
MDNFGVSYEEMADKGYNIDYVRKVIKSINTDSLVEGAGEMIAFMMQYNMDE